jgi:hypothetical protein
MDEARATRAGPGAGEAWSYAWARAKQDFAGVILPPAVALALAGAINIGLNLGIGLMVGGGLAVKSGVAGAVLGGAVVQAVLALPSAAVAAFFLAGIMRFATRLVRGEKPGFAEVFSGGQILVPALVAGLITLGLPTAFSAFLRLAPIGGAALGILVAFAGAVLSSFALASVVRGRDGIQAVQDAFAQVSAGIGTAVLLPLFGGLGVLACCVGAFVTMPLMFVSIAYVCARRAGEPVA